MPSRSLQLLCHGRRHCQACRDRTGGRAFRASVIEIFDVPGGVVDFACPHGLPWDWDGNTPPEASAQPGLLDKAAGLARAVMTGSYVAEAVRVEREAICQTCAYATTRPTGRQCRLCGCRVSGAMIVALTAYEELIDRNGKIKQGCKHPRRGEPGQGWPLPILPAPTEARTAVDDRSTDI